MAHKKTNGLRLDNNHAETCAVGATQNSATCPFTSKVQLGIRFKFENVITSINSKGEDMIEGIEVFSLAAPACAAPRPRGG